MEQILEQPDERDRDFVVYSGIKPSGREGQLARVLRRRQPWAMQPKGSLVHNADRRATDMLSGERSVPLGAKRSIGRLRRPAEDAEPS